MSEPDRPPARRPAGDPAPLFTDAFDLCAWVLARLDGTRTPLSVDLCRLSLALLDAVTDGLRSREEPTALIAADDLLGRLRLRLRLAGVIGLLDERRMLHALARADALGRQLGALLRHRRGPGP